MNGPSERKLWAAAMAPFVLAILAGVIPGVIFLALR